jgi:hypothetical protein
VKKVAKATPAAGLFVKIPAPRLSKICHGTKFHLHLASFVESTVHGLQGVAGIFFVEEFAINVANHVITEVVADMQFVDSTECGEFQKHILVKTEKVFKGLHFVDSRFAAFISVALYPRNCLFEFCDAYGMTIDVFD